MKRIMITMGAALLVAVPATLGLVGNTSFAQSVPVRVPAQATVLDDNGGQRATTEKSDDNARHLETHSTEPRHHNGGASAEPGDDNGGLRDAHSAEPGDDNGGQRAIPTTEPSHHKAGDSSAAKDDNGEHGTDSGRKAGEASGSGHT